jgi:hypothetical protein
MRGKNYKLNGLQTKLGYLRNLSVVEMSNRKNKVKLN